MVKTASTMLELGTIAPDFSLQNIDGSTVSRQDFSDAKGLLVVFMCNHCPYVKHVASQLAALHHDFRDQGLAMVGISSNDAEAYPDDSPESMVSEAAAQGYEFPYLYDPTQEVAKAYRAACTPDFFLFDAEHKLYYRGQLDSSRPKSETPVTGADLRNAIASLLAGDPRPENQVPSLGCNIKWKPGNEPDFFSSTGVAG